MFSTESVSCVRLLEGVGWVTAVAAVGASAEPTPTSVGTAKTDAKSLSGAGKIRPRPEQRSTVSTDVETRAKNFPERAEMSSVLTRSPYVQKSQKSAEVKGNPPKKALSVRGNSPPAWTPGIGEEGVLYPQVRMRYIPPSWSRSAKGQTRLNHPRNDGCRAARTPPKRWLPEAYDPTRHVG